MTFFRKEVRPRVLAWNWGEYSLQKVVRDILKIQKSFALFEECLIDEIGANILLDQYCLDIETNFFEQRSFIRKV